MSKTPQHVPAAFQMTSVETGQVPYHNRAGTRHPCQSRSVPEDTEPRQSIRCFLPAFIALWHVAPTRGVAAPQVAPLVLSALVSPGTMRVSAHPSAAGDRGVVAGIMLVLRSAAMLISARVSFSVSRWEPLFSGADTVVWIVALVAVLQRPRVKLTVAAQQ